MPIEAAIPVPTVRESLESAMDTVSNAGPIPAQEPAPQVEVKAEPPPAPAQETEAQRAERLRDEKGRFLPEGQKPQVAAVPAVPAPVIPKVPRPSSWKKELEPQWETLTPELQSYVNQREREYQTGVSTYKTEADRAKGVMEAVAPFEQILQQHNIPVSQWITNLGRAHHTLATGSPQDKVALVANIIRANNVDGNALFQILSGQQPMPPAPQQQAPAQPQITQQDIDARIQQAVTAREVQQAYKAFTEAKDEKGNPKYPHVEAVKGTMAGLLQADLAQDYPSAYDAALRMPQHADIWNALQQQQASQKEAERLAAEQAKVGRARSQAVSVRSSTPSQMTQAEGPKSLRDQLSESFDRHAGGRV